MEILNKIIKNIPYDKLLNSLIVLIISIVIYKIITFFLNKSEEKSKLFTSNKSKTYLKLLKSIIKSILIILTILIILQINGINVSSILAGVGLFGIIFGLAIQDWLKDVIRGSSIISDNYFEVGNIIKYKDIEGKVLVIGLKTTKIQDLKTRNIISIANRNIEEVEVVSKYVMINIPMPYEVKLSKAEKAIDDIIELIKKNDNIINCKYKGVNDLASSSIDYQLEIECNQQYKLQVRRDSLRSIIIGLEKNNIEVPYTQIDIHNK